MSLIDDSGQEWGDIGSGGSQFGLRGPPCWKRKDFWSIIKSWKMPSVEAHRPETLLATSKWNSLKDSQNSLETIVAQKSYIFSEGGHLESNSPSPDAFLKRIQILYDGICANSFLHSSSSSSCFLISKSMARICCGFYDEFWANTGQAN